MILVNPAWRLEDGLAALLAALGPALGRPDATDAARLAGPGINPT
ncbi:MAG: hypothetical protein WDO24_06605 [Pseudomonadota bacterium]